MIKSTFIRIVTPFALRPRKQAGHLLHRFAITEADSGWQLIQAMHQIDDAQLKARLFHNAMEELHHAELFGRLADQFVGYTPRAPAPARRRLFAEAPSIAAFEAYHYVGERDVFEQFRAYAYAAPPGPIRDTFLAIRADEEGHQHDALEDLVRLAGSEAEARRLVKRVRLERLKDGLSRGANAVGDAVSTILLTGLFAVFGPLLVAVCRRRLREASWASVQQPANLAHRPDPAVAR